MGQEPTQTQPEGKEKISEEELEYAVVEYLAKRRAIDETLKDNKEERARNIEELNNHYYNDVLGVIDTNNLRNYFVKKSSEDYDKNILSMVYGIDYEKNAGNPQIEIIRKFRENYPELFNKAQDIATKRNNIFKTIANKTIAGTSVSRADEFEDTLSSWELMLSMTEVVEKLKESGITEEGIESIYM